MNNQHRFAKCPVLKRARHALVFSLTLALVCGGRLGAPAAADDNRPNVSVYNVSATFGLPTAERGLAGWAENTHIALVVRAPDRDLVGLNRDRSKLVRLTDDKGTDLLQAEAGRQATVSPWLITNEAKRAAVVTINAPRAPATGATTFDLKAELAVICGLDERESILESFQLEVGNSAKVGPAEVKVTAVDGYPRLALIFQGNLVKHAELKSETGELLRFQGGTGAPKGIGNTETHNYYAIRADMKSVQIKLRAYNSTEEMFVPVEMKFGLGGELKPQGQE